MNVYSPLEPVFDSLESLADAISESLCSQVTIEDENHRVIAYSSHRQESDPARISTIISRQVPERVIAGLRKAGVLQRLEQSTAALRIPAMPDIGLGPRLTICIRHRQVVLGYIWVVDAGNLSEGDAERLLAEAAEIAKRHLLVRRSGRARQAKMQDDFFWKILTSSYVSERQLFQEAEALSLRLPERYTLVILALAQPLDETQLDRMRDLIATFGEVRPELLLADQQQLIGLFRQVAKTPQKSAFLSFVSGTIKQWNAAHGAAAVVSAAVSRPYGGYMDASRAYQEALTVIEIRKMYPYHAREMVHYDEIGFFADLPAMIENRRTTHYRSPALMKLRDHDLEHQTELVRTLSVYLSFNRNPKASAAQLHIHANTLTYRLNRIAEITGLDMRDMNAAVTVYLDLLIEERASLNEWFS